jgi:hypothetical protein
VAANFQWNNNMLTLTNINPYGSLSSTELTVMGSLEKLISANTPKKILKVTDAFKNYSLTTQAKLIHSNEIIREFCQTNSTVRTIISDKLKEFNSPNIDVISKDKLESHTILDHVFGYHLMDAFVSQKRDDSSGQSRANILRDACAIGSYHGLVIRCKFNLVALNNSAITSDAEKKQKVLEKILVDCDHLSNLYGAIGYIRKAIVLLELSLCFDTQNDKDRMVIYKQQAIKNFVCASLLQEDKYSNALIDSITNGAGVSSLFADTNNEFQLGDWVAAKVLFQESIGKDAYAMLERQANSDIQPDLARAEYLLKTPEVQAKPGPP